MLGGIESLMPRQRHVDLPGSRAHRSRRNDSCELAEQEKETIPNNGFTRKPRFK